MTEGDNNAGLFSEEFGNAEGQLIAFVYSMHPYANDVDDILQETLTTLWEHFSEYDQERSFLNWACGFAYFKVKEQRRREARRHRLFRLETLQALAEVDQPCETSIDRESALNGCLSSLSEEDRALIDQRYSDECSLKQMAETIGKTANTLYKRLQRIRFQLAECIEQKLRTI